RTEFCAGGNAPRCSKAPFHHGGICRIRSAGTAGAYFDGRLDTPAWRQALANAAPRDLFGGGARGNPLLLAGEVGYQEAGGLWRAGGGAARLASVVLGGKEESRCHGAGNRAHGGAQQLSPALGLSGRWRFRRSPARARRTRVPKSAERASGIRSPPAGRPRTGRPGKQFGTR